MSEIKTITKKLKITKDSLYNLHNVSGASLSAFGNTRSVLNFFIDRPVLPEYAELQIQEDSGLIIKENLNIDNDFVDIERIFVAGIDLDYNTLKSISTLLLNHINTVENSKKLK